MDEAGCVKAATGSEFLTDAATAIADLPRLLYMGDVPVEASYHGSALLYRLLQTYPADRLVIVEAGVATSKPERQLANVDYHAARIPMSRLQTTRFAPWYTAGCLRSASLRAGPLAGLARAARAQAILTVTHGYSWITAAELARRLDVPLHLICHDEWARAGAMQDWKDRVFGKHYRAAASRLCVSPFMAKEYTLRYGAEGRVLYPSRAADSHLYEGPPSRLGESTKSFTCAFAGTINSGGTVIALQRLASVLAPHGGKLLIYGPLTADVARRSGLDATNIELGGLLPSAQLMDKLRERADALFVPMSFDDADRNNMEISFPSKLTDYTTVGLPLLVYGPPYCSAAQWANANDGVVEVVTEEGGDALSAAISRLAGDPGHRLALAERALAVGEVYFSHGAALAVFHKGLAKAQPSLDSERDATQSAEQFTTKT